MRAAVYRSKGIAREVLSIEEISKPIPAYGEVLVQISYSGVNPSDVKARSGVSSPDMDYPFVVPHSDGAGRIIAVGDGVPDTRVGSRVWTFNGQWKRPMGTAAEFLAIPSEQAVDLPTGISDQDGAAIGIPLMTAVHAIRALRSTVGKFVVVFGAAGVVGSYVTQLCAKAGARVIAVVSGPDKGRQAIALGAELAVNYRSGDISREIREHTKGSGVDAIIDLDGSTNSKYYGQILRFGGDIIIYGSSQPHIELAFRPLMAVFARLYFFIVYMLPDSEKREIIRTVTELLRSHALQHPPRFILPLQAIADAHRLVEAGASGKVLLKL